MAATFFLSIIPFIADWIFMAASCTSLSSRSGISSPSLSVELDTRLCEGGDSLDRLDGVVSLLDSVTEESEAVSSLPLTESDSESLVSVCSSSSEEDDSSEVVVLRLISLFFIFFNSLFSFSRLKNL